MKVVNFVFSFPNYLIISIIASLIVSLLTDLVYGFFTLLGFVGLVIITVFVREIWRFFHEGSNKKGV